MTLDGTASETANGHRLNFLSGLIDHCQTKVNHIDGLRQRNMSIALAIFAVLVGFGLRASGHLPAVFTASALFALTLTSCLLDRRLHKWSHGWRGTAHGMLTAAKNALNEPVEPISFERYRSTSEAEAELFSLLPILYYILVLLSGLAYFAFVAVGATNP